MRVLLTLILICSGLISTALADDSLHFALTDQNGRIVSEADYRGRPLLLTFGYTFCPDVCPTSLQTIAAAVDRLGTEGERVRFALVTVDPQRDTPEHLAGYVALFHPRLQGLTGSEKAIAAIARQLKVRYAKVVIRPEDPDGYGMDHTSSFFLVGANGRLAARLPHSLSVEALAERIARHLKGGA